MIARRFEVRFTIDVVASSPEQAATIARDILLDPDTQVGADVHAYEYYKPADDWLPREHQGVSAYFGDVGNWSQTYGGRLPTYKGPSVKPIESIAWTSNPVKKG